MYKIIVADDEMVECIALERMLSEMPEQMKVLKSAKNGEELIRYVEKEHPDIAIVDINMPGLNGLEAVNLLRLYQQDIKVIIHSAYYEYEYMQRAMQLGAMDYILKPASRKSVTAAVRKAIEKLASEQADRTIQEKNDRLVEDMQHVLGQELAMSVLMGKPDEKSFRIFQHGHGIEEEGGIMLVCRNAFASTRMMTQEIYASLDQEMERLCIHFGTYYQENIYLWMAVSASSFASGFEEYLENILNSVSMTIEKKFQIKLLIGISGWKGSFTQSTQALREAQIALQMIRSDEEQYLQFQSMQSVKAENPFLSIKEEAETDSAVRNLFADLQLKRISLEQIKVWIIDYLYQDQPNKKNDLVLPSMFLSVSENWTALWLLGDLQHVEAWFIQVLQNRKNSEKRNTITLYVEKGLQYMEDHYDQDISLDNTAEYANVSSFYLTRLFRQELQKSFVELLTEIRLSHAIDLIREGSLTTREIAAACGYGNAVYFNRVFKKNTGMTPKQMKDYWKGDNSMEAKKE